MHTLPFHRVIVTISNHFLNFPPQKPYMQWYSSMQIPPFDRVLVTIASYFLNFPPQTLHAIVVLNANPSLSKSSCHDCKSFSKLPPPFASPTCNFYSSMHILPFHRVLVTIASPFLNFPPQSLHAMVFLNALSSCHDGMSFSKLPTPKPYMQ